MLNNSSDFKSTKKRILDSRILGEFRHFCFKNHDCKNRFTNECHNCLKYRRGFPSRPS